ncbi:MAG: (Fe-S)-binding protein [Deltaproteobacteria bacterium]|nr:(Fe-S)-binding protein [Deltaproteobacteria bacterium]
MRNTKNMTEETLAGAWNLLDKRLSRPMVTFLEVCTHCGVCSDACHLYKVSGDPIHIPSFKADRLRRVYKRRYTWLGRWLPWLAGAKELTDGEMNGWVDAVYQCTLCRRCTINCPIGIDNALIIRTARTLLHAAGKGPAQLEEHTRNALETGSPLRVTSETFQERIAWFEGELQERLGDDFQIPLDRKGADMLYMPASLELMKFPQTVMSTLELFHRAGADYTLSTVRYDVTNYAVFNGDDEAAREIASRDIAEAERLGVKKVVVSECGHAFRALRWEAPNWLHKPLPFEVVDVVELVHHWLKAGRLTLDPAKNQEQVTYHDPCNIGRNGGLFDEPRELLGASVKNFTEMTPNRENNWCCGGGGGMLSMPEYRETRLAASGMKAGQVRATGAKVLATACANCQFQLNEMAQHHGLDIRVESITDLVAAALTKNA